MSEGSKHNLGLVEYVRAEALGVPGQRTFNITARSSRGQAVVWMEKEQLFQVGISIKQFIATRESTADPLPFDIDIPVPPVPISVEFKTGDMSLRHDSGSDAFTLTAQDSANDEEERQAAPSEVEFSFTRADAERLADNAIEVVAAGRPPCPLCGGPLDSGDHFCVKVNGHNRHVEPPR